MQLKPAPLLKCAYTSENVNNASYTDMDIYSSVEEQKKYSVVEIELQLVV